IRPADTCSSLDAAGARTGTVIVAMATSAWIASVATRGRRVERMRGGRRTVCDGAARGTMRRASALIVRGRWSACQMNVDSARASAAASTRTRRLPLIVDTGHRDRRAKRDRRRWYPTRKRRRLRDLSTGLRWTARKRPMGRGAPMIQMKTSGIRPSHTAAVLLLAATVASAQTATPAPGVPLDLARARAQILGDLRYELALSVPAAKDQPIGGHMVLRFRLTDATRPLVLD